MYVCVNVNTGLRVCSLMIHVYTMYVCVGVNMALSVCSLYDVYNVCMCNVNMALSVCNLMI